MKRDYAKRLQSIRKTIHKSRHANPYSFHAFIIKIYKYISDGFSVVAWRHYNHKRPTPGIANAINPKTLFHKITKLITRKYKCIIN